MFRYGVDLLLNKWVLLGNIFETMSTKRAISGVVLTCSPTMIKDKTLDIKPHIHIEFPPSLVTLWTSKDCRVVHPPGMLVETQPPVESLVAPLALAREGLSCEKFTSVNLLVR